MPRGLDLAGMHLLHQPSNPPGQLRGTVGHLSPVSALGHSRSVLPRRLLQVGKWERRKPPICVALVAQVQQWLCQPKSGLPGRPARTQSPWETGLDSGLPSGVTSLRHQPLLHTSNSGTSAMASFCWKDNLDSYFRRPCSSLTCSYPRASPFRSDLQRPSLIRSKGGRTLHW
jgi:hypothetical protein